MKARPGDIRTSYLTEPTPMGLEPINDKDLTGEKAIKADYESDRAITVDLSEDPLLT
mgnify:CR=1 FL=1